ncbi:hypothetical protein IH879_10645 [candidate division KSB1 bacterium]|nr:hypothetical protein [candidate division KSB1 bacterium]
MTNKTINLDGRTIQELSDLKRQGLISALVPENSAENFTVEFNRVVNLTPEELIREFAEAVHGSA